MKILAFGHRKFVGKDTAARFLITELRLRNPGINIKKVGFADKVKSVSFDIFGWAGLKPGPFYDEPENLHLKDIVLPLIGKTPRELYIGVGNGVRAATGHDSVWLDYVFYAIKCDVLVISDLRFEAEAQGILDAGGFIYRIDKDSIPKYTDGADEKLKDFVNWTGVIKNNGTIKELHAEVLKLVERHF